MFKESVFQLKEIRNSENYIAKNANVKNAKGDFENLKMEFLRKGRGREVMLVRPQKDAACSVSS